MAGGLHGLPWLAKNLGQIVGKIHSGVEGRGTLHNNDQISQQHPRMSVAQSLHRRVVLGKPPDGGSVLALVVGEAPQNHQPAPKLENSNHCNYLLFGDGVDKERNEEEWNEASKNRWEQTLPIEGMEQKLNWHSKCGNNKKNSHDNAETHSRLGVRQFGTGQSQISANSWQVEPEESPHFSISGAQLGSESLWNKTKSIWPPEVPKMLGGGIQTQPGI
jgi:hypothetical protein